MLIDSLNTGAYAFLGPMTYGGPPRDRMQNEGKKLGTKRLIVASIPRPNPNSPGGWPRDAHLDLGPIAAT